MKNKFVLLLALLFVASVARPDVETTDRIVLSEIGNVTPGSGDTYSFTVSLEGSDTYYTAFEIDLTFPEGLSVAYNTSGKARVVMVRSNLYPFTTNEEENEDGEIVEVKDYSHELTAGMVSSNRLKVIVMSMENENFTETSGALFKVYVQASPYLKPGSNGIGVSAKLFTKDEKSYTPKEYTSNTLTVENSSSLTLAVSSENQFGTCILPFNYNLPADGSLKAYTCNQCTIEELLLTEEQTMMQAYTPYILYSPSGFSDNISGTVDAEKYPEGGIVKQGYLVGTVVQKQLMESTSYVMQNQGYGALFYSVGETPFVLSAGKCYAELPDGSEARFIHFDDATGIFETENGERKMENCHDLSGRRVEKLQKGVYIVNGNKVVKQ
ncbi:MAG: hypothetical protein IKW22_04540 [Bacteroidaceae bacterium]|nr:hypothetical protein [Bacteroidaceae bacterium]